MTLDSNPYQSTNKKTTQHSSFDNDFSLALFKEIIVLIAFFLKEMIPV